MKSSAGNTLKVLNGGADSVQKILDNYDVKFEAIAEGFEDKIVIDDFDQTILSLIKNLPKTPVITTNSNALSETNNSLRNSCAKLSINKCRFKFCPADIVRRVYKTLKYNI